MIRESQIKHENGKYWVLSIGGAYQVMVSGATHSTCDSAYSDFSLAVVRCNYLAMRDKQKQK